MTYNMSVELDQLSARRCKGHDILFTRRLTVDQVALQLSSVYKGIRKRFQRERFLLHDQRCPASVSEDSQTTQLTVSALLSMRPSPACTHPSPY